jgi:hypothetical protein
MTILEEAYHSMIIVEHDPLLYEDSAEMVEYIQQALKQVAHEAKAQVDEWPHFSHLERSDT